jgi:hypothetical protein
MYIDAVILVYSTKKKVVELSNNVYLFYRILQYVGLCAYTVPLEVYNM